MEKTFRSGSNRLRNWKEEGEIIVWIHTNTQIHKRLFHMVPYVGIKKDDQGESGNGKKSILYHPFVCHENVKEYLNEGRSFTPSKCPICRFIELLKNDGNISDGETVWESSVRDRKRDRICTKADFVGDIEGGGDWRLAFKPSMQYIITVIDHEHPEDNIRVTAEKFSLGEKIKSSIFKEIDRKGIELGDPDKNPYAFKWIFNPKARAKTDYYDAYPYEKATLTDEIKELLMHPELDLSPWIAPGDTKLLRQIMEAHITLEDIDFDMLFDNVLPNQGLNNSDESESSEPNEEKTDEVQEQKKTKTRQAIPPKEEVLEESIPSDNMMECPSCRGKGIKKDGRTCKVCEGTGQVEAPEDDRPKRESPIQSPEPKVKERKTRTVKTPEPPPEEDSGEEVAECGRCHKDIPVSATSCPYCGASFE